MLEFASSIFTFFPFICLPATFVNNSSTYLAGISIKELRVDGGATVNNALMQFQADVLNTVTVRPKVVETTAMGAAFLAGLAVGYWKNAEEIQEMWQTDLYFTPAKERESIEQEIQGWYKAIDALDYWTKIKV